MYISQIMRINSKKAWLIVASICLVAILGLSAIYAVVSINAHGRTYDDVKDIPSFEYGLLLGTSPITPQGAHNYYFDNRIKAAAELYEAGKVEKIIASGGDYSGEQTNGCNELEAMRDSLVAHGVPARYIYLDYDGLRTINSIAKAKGEIDQKSCVIISQEYHNQRALWLADHFELNAVAYNAAPSHILQKRIKNIAREFLARPKMLLDLCFGEKPSFESQYTSYDFDIKNGEFKNGDLAFCGVDSAIMKYSADYYDDIQMRYNHTDSILKILCESKKESSYIFMGKNLYTGINKVQPMISDEEEDAAKNDFLRTFIVSRKKRLVVAYKKFGYHDDALKVLEEMNAAGDGDEWTAGYKNYLLDLKRQREEEKNPGNSKTEEK